MLITDVGSPGAIIGRQIVAAPGEIPSVDQERDKPIIHGLNFEHLIDISRNLDILCFMDLLEIFKALSNRTRLDILNRLKDPENSFPPQDEGDVHTVGVCVSSIQEGVGLSQSTVSNYLAMLQRTGLVDVQRVGQWTYYKRNEEAIRSLAELIGKDL